MLPSESINFSHQSTRHLQC